MGTLDANGIYFYETTDPVSPLQTLLNLGQQSVSDAVGGRQRVYEQASGSAPATPNEGDTWYQTDTEAWGIYTGTAWRFWDTVWRTYSPTLSFAVGTLGSPVSDTRWRYEGDFVRVDYRFVFGTNGTATFGSGATMTLPVTPLAGETYRLGVGDIFRAPNTYLALPRIDSGPVIRITTGTSPMADVSATSPAGGAWAAGDGMRGSIIYRPA